MLQACKLCHEQFDNTKKRSDCPHKDFPKQCEEHARFNCSNPECVNPKPKTLRFDKSKEA